MMVPNVYPILKVHYENLHIYLPVTFVYFLQIRLILNIFNCFCMILNQHFTFIRVLISQKLKSYNVNLRHIVFTGRQG